MTIIQFLIAAVGFILCLPFVAAWVILAMIRGRNRHDGEAPGLMSPAARSSWLGRLALRGRQFGEHASLVGRRSQGVSNSDAEVEVV